MNSWFEDIERARTEDEVLARARDFLCLLHPRELGALPPERREIRIDEGGDISRLRERLTEACALPPTPACDTQRLREAVEYLSRASVRLGELRESP